MPADDTSHFDLANAGSDKGGAVSAEVTIDSLWTEYDKIADAGLSEKSDEYQELREKIRQFAEDNKLDVRLSRTKNNKQLLEEIEEAMDGAAPVSTETKAAEESTDNEPEENDDDKDGAAEEAAPVERRRRPRPTAEPEDNTDDAKPEEIKAEEAAPAEDGNASEERPLHRRRRRS